MINRGNDVPEKTIAVFKSQRQLPSVTKDTISAVIEKPGKKRDWFTPHFYRCLPLSIGNQYGFVIKAGCDFSVEWGGLDDKESLVIEAPDLKPGIYPEVYSHFGSGIMTCVLPFTFRTPPGVNLMTINPPNTVIPNITVMTGVVEADNLRYQFTINLRVQMPHLKVHFKKGATIAAILPIPRYFADQFELLPAEELFSEELIEEELKAEEDMQQYRVTVEPNLKNQGNRLYMQGVDVYNNAFPDHQKPGIG